jgi:Glycosyltransferase
MAILINPFGRMVAVDDQKEVGELLLQGFIQATADQERSYLEEQRAKKARMQNGSDSRMGVYLSTVSHVGGNDGYGVASQMIVKGLESLGIPVSTHYTGQKVAILFHNPYSLPRIEAPYRILYTMFESTKIPEDWSDYLQAADMVIVPSKWCQSVFAKSGIETKVVPLGYDNEVFKYVDREDKGKGRKTFSFLHYNAFNLRKGFRELWTAFNREFEKTEPVKLILKTTLEHTPLPIIQSEYPNVEVIRGGATKKELFEICKRSDCFVFPSMGEGFGMPPLEAMATGLPLIMPNSHGLTEYYNDKLMYDVKIEKEVPAVYSRYKGVDTGKMFMSSIEDLQKKMRWVYEHQSEAKQRGKLLSEYALSWTFQNTAEQLKEIINGVLEKPLPSRRDTNVLTLEKVH